MEMREEDAEESLHPGRRRGKGEERHQNPERQAGIKAPSHSSGSGGGLRRRSGRAVRTWRPSTAPGALRPPSRSNTTRWVLLTYKGCTDDRLGSYNSLTAYRPPTKDRLALQYMFLK